MAMIRCISLWQPYATLIAIGVKLYETRDWATPFRGPLAIHAGLITKSAKDDYDLQEYFDDPRFHDHLVAAGYASWKDLPRGAFVCRTSLDSCQQVVSSDTKIFNRDKFMHPPELPQDDYGGFAPGRYAWGLRNTTRFAKPVVSKGQQGFWQVDELWLQDQSS